MFCHVTLKFKEINNFKQTRNFKEIKRLVKIFNNYGVVQVSQTTSDESVLFWTSCKCLWTLYGAKTSQRKSQFSSWSTYLLNQFRNYEIKFAWIFWPITTSFTSLLFFLVCGTKLSTMASRQWLQPKLCILWWRTCKWILCSSILLS